MRLLRMSYWSSNSILVYILKYICKNPNWKRYMHPSVHSSIIYSCQDMKASWVSINRWMDKGDVICVCVCVYIYIGILLSHKKEWNFALCSNKNGLGWHNAKWNKSDRERHILYDITYMECKKYNKSAYNKKAADIYIDNKLVVTSRETEGGGAI